MKYYNLNFRTLVILLLPTFLRKPRFIAFLQTAIVPLSNLHTKFLQRQKEDHYKLDHTWQKCYLQKVLNDAFDVDLRRITIDEGDRYERKYIYTNAEKKPKYLGLIYLRRAEDFADTGYDFTVNMNGVRADWYDVNAMTRFYKLEGTRFNIINLG